MLIFLCACVRQQPPFKKPRHNLVVVVPSYNNRTWYRTNLDSIRRQRHPSFRVIYIDDASTDGTAQRVARYIQKHQLNNFSLIANTQRKGSLANTWQAIGMCDPHDIVVTLDGDDWLAHRHVLEHIDTAFTEHRAWFVYGQFKNWPTGTIGWSIQPPQHQNWRAWGFHIGQPRAFFAWLAHKINPDDFINPASGQFYTVAGDVALAFPLVEMAGAHVHFIDEILTIRNVRTPLNDFKLRAREQLDTAYTIRRKKPYKPLPEPAKPLYNQTNY